MESLNWALYLGASLIGGGVSAYITHWLRLKESRQDKWWDIKVSTYNEIYNSMSSMKLSLYSWMEELESGSRIEKKRREILYEKHDEAVENVRFTVSAGNFIISDYAEKLLKELLAQLDNVFDESLYIAFEKSYEIVSDAQRKFNLEAKNDLQIK